MNSKADEFLISCTLNLYPELIASGVELWLVKETDQSVLIEATGSAGWR